MYCWRDTRVPGVNHRFGASRSKEVNSTFCYSHNQVRKFSDDWHRLHRQLPFQPPCSHRVHDWSKTYIVYYSSHVLMLRYIVLPINFGKLRHGRVFLSPLELWVRIPLMERCTPNPVNLISYFKTANVLFTEVNLDRWDQLSNR